jgi:hypothetical protein
MSKGGTGGSVSTGGAGGSVSTGGAGGSVSTGGTSGSVSAGGTGQAGRGATPAGGAGAVNGVGGAAAGTGGAVASGGAASGGGGGTVAMGGSNAGGMSAGGSAGTGAGGASCTPPTGAPTEQVITFNDNGGWCWYQDERVIVDTKNNRMVIGSMASGGSRNGNVEAVVYDLGANSGKTTILNNLSCDDHNAPGFVITGSGTIAAMWATHRENCNSYFATFDGSAWASTKTYDWSKGDGCPWAGASTNMVTYANPWLMATESNRLYSGVRSVDTSPSFLSSTDDGKSWGYYGRLTASKQTGYVAGYYKYWGNGTDRIDWVGTEAHPRDDDNSLWHGYVKGGKVYDSFDKVVDDNIADKTAQDVSKFTPVFKTGTTINGVVLNHMWNHDIMRYADGTIAVLGQGRVNGTGSDDPDKRMIYSRFDGKAWTTTYLVKAGSKLYADEQDYTGLSALNPDNPNIIYVSTPYDPRDDKTMSANKKHELWQGTTCDNGKTFTFTPITQNSSVDQIRPVVPKWDSSHTALLWMQGTYKSAQSYTMKIVGLIMTH